MISYKYRWVIHYSYSTAQMISLSSLKEFALVDRNHCLQWEGIEYVTASFDRTIHQHILIRLSSEVFQCSTWTNGQEHMRSWHESQDFRKTVTSHNQLERLKPKNASDQALKSFFVREFALKVLTLDIPPQFTSMRIRRPVPFRIWFCNDASVRSPKYVSPDLAARHQ